jgi:hypothetical protein
MLSTNERIRTANTILCRGAYRKFLRELAMASPVGALSAPQPAVGDITGTTGTADYGRGHVDTPCGGGAPVSVALDGGL